MTQKMNNKKCYPFHVDHLPESFYQKASEELNETPETREVELKKFKDLLLADRMTAGIEFEEDFLHLFLRYRKYDSLQAFQALRKFLNFRRNYSSIFTGISEKYFNESSCTKFISVLPNRCPDGCAIMLYELGKWDPNELPIEDFKRFCMFSYFIPLRYPMTQISGFKGILDFKDTVKHLRYCTPQNLSLVYNASFNCNPGRYKEIHCINKSAFLSAAWAILKHALPEKIRKRIFFLSNPEDLLNYFSSSLVPTQYGGQLDNYHDSELMKKMNKEIENYPEEGLPNYF